MDEEQDPTIRAFFDDFVAAFSSFGGDRVANKFSLPYMAKGPGDVCRVFDSRSDLAAYFQSYLDDYHSQGCRECRYSNLFINWLGSECAVASVNWDLLDAAGISVTSWSESYMLSFGDGKALAFATVDQVE
ncbi:hypothetical protein [Marinobacter sp. OP 3.4]|uniref:hypothetical protein n=1 Tax=Marinobacter sp. OP 3.4 TaxID=3076501 RepID=UPI002E1BD010